MFAGVDTHKTPSRGVIDRGQAGRVGNSSCQTKTSSYARLLALLST